jgi:ankyrin repeat protein
MRTIPVLFFNQSDEVLSAARDRQGCTALHWAAAAGELEACRWLADAGLPTGGGGGRERRGPLHLAARHGRLAVCRWLVEERGADPDARAKHGVSPLQLAVCRGSRTHGTLAGAC